MVIMAVVLTVISVGLGAVVRENSKRNFKLPFIMLMVAQNLIFWGYVLEVASPDLGTKLMWNNLEYLGYVTAVASFFLLSLQYGTDTKVDWKIWTLLLVPLSLTLVAVITNPYHHLFYSSVVLSSDYYLSFEPVYGPLFYGYMSYAAVIMLAGLSVLFSQFIRASSSHRPKVGITCLAAVLAISSVLLNFTGVVPIAGGIMLVMGFLASDLLLFVGAFGFELFSMIPFEMERILHLSRNGFFILDVNDVIVYQNPVAEALSGSNISKSNSRLEDVLPTFPRYALAGTGKTNMDMEDVHELAPGRFFDVTVLTIKDYAGRPVGKTIMLREVSAQRKAEAEARAAKHTLDLMNSITRHDVLNQLTVIEGNLVMAASKTDAAAIQRHIDASYRAAQSIQAQMQFAKDYQEMPKRVPVWQSVEDKMLETGAALDLKGAKLSVDVKGVEMLADLLLGKVFYNLMQNSIAHGGKVRDLRLTAVEDDAGLQLIYTDDGMGIDPKMRSALFIKGAGHNSGLGLYLSREILAHSNMTITEEGAPGEGARFVIRAPKGTYRMVNGAHAMAHSSMRPSPLTP